MMLVSPIRATSGKSYRLGLEVDADIRINDQFSIRPNIAISSNKNVDFNATINGDLVNLGNTPISNSPDIIAGNAYDLLSAFRKLTTFIF